MYGPQEPQTRNTLHGNVHGNVVQSGSMRDVHVHPSSQPVHRDPWLVLLGVVALVTGLELAVLFLMLCAWGLLMEFYGFMSFVHNATAPSADDVLPSLPSVGLVVVLLVGFLAVNLLRTAWDLMGRRRHAWRQDAFAGQSSLWLLLLALVLMVGQPFLLLAVPIGIVAAATVAAVALTCRGGTRRRWGFVVAAGVVAALWFGPVLWGVWMSGAQLLLQGAGTLVLLVGMAVPVLAVTAMPATCGGVVLRGWAQGIVLTLILVWGVLDSMSPPMTVKVPVLVSTACVVVLTVVLSVLLNRSAGATDSG